MAAPKQTDPPTPEAESGPVNLDPVELVGASRAGKAVARLLVIYTDGKRAYLDLPEPGEAPDLTGVTPTMRRILKELRDSPVPLTRKAVAKRMNRTSTRGKFGDAFRQLVSRGEIQERDDLYTDDASKYGATNS